MCLPTKFFFSPDLVIGAFESRAVVVLRYVCMYVVSTSSCADMYMCVCIKYVCVHVLYMYMYCTHTNKTLQTLEKFTVSL